MPSRDTSQYLRFAEQRTQPCRDLVSRVALDPRRIIDLGCGPGNSTQVLAERWPDAEITGLDSSAETIAKARSECAGRRWIAAEISEWAERTADRYDLVFSNAALQWVGDHPGLFPLLLSHVEKGGALAVQMPGNWDAAAHRLMRNIAAQFPATEAAREWFTHSLGFYYDVFAPHAARIDLWATEYIHVMDSAEGIVEWYKGTGMRPFLDALTSEEERERFLALYLDAISEAYPPRTGGQVLFPFRRVFMVAYA
jgi:trans-aconitate 2-methyltransferase